MINIGSEYNIKEYTLILSKRNHKHLGQIRNVSDVVSKINMNSANEISFTVYKYSDIEKKEIDPLWNEIVDFKYVYVKELDEYYEIYVDLNDGEMLSKSVTGTSACECELSQTYLYGLEINTESDIAREDYENPTIFYKPDHPEESLLHRVLSKAPQYSIKYVDYSLKDIQRTFSADGEDIYSFLTSTVAEEIHCLFLFDTTDRSISVYDLETLCLDCGYRGDYSGECPKCHSTNLKFYGEDTTVYIDTENLAENITFTTDVESVKNCFKLEAGDDNMTAAVTNLNPNGSSYIYYFSEDQKNEMSQELIEKLDDYNSLNDSYKPEYETVMNNMYEAIDKIVYYTSEMMPTIEHEETDAKKEASKLTEENLSPLGLPSVKSSTSTATVNTALKNYAKVFVHTGKYKVEVNEGNFVYSTVGQGNYGHGTWTGNFKLTSFSDEEDTAISNTITVEVNDQYKEFLEQKIMKKLAENKDEDGNIFDVLSIEGLEEFTRALTYYCLNRLTSFYDAIQGVIDIMIEEDQAKKDATFYNELYLPYKNKLDACQNEIDKRELVISNYEKNLEESQSRQKEIQKILNFEEYLGKELYSEFCCHRREDKYSNENYVSDGLNNDELFKRAKEFLEEANNELVKSGEHQHTISASLLDLLSLKEFEPLKDKVKTGNFIRIGVDKKVYRLRLISIQNTQDETNESINNIDVEFSDLTKIKNGVSDLNSILNQASSIAGSYDAVAHQVDKAKESDKLVRNWVERGLDLTNMKIISGASNQNFVQDKNGMLIRTYDDITETYGDEQMKIVNSTLAITDDNWKTIKAAIGRYYYVDPTDGESKMAYGVNAETLVGKLILGESLGIYSQDAYSSMTFDNRGLILNANKGADGRYDRIIDIKIDGKSKFYIDRNGDLVINNGQIGTIDESLEKVIERVSTLELGLDGFKSEVSTTYVNKSELNQVKEDIANDVSTSVEGKVDEKLLSYSTTEQTKTLIQQSADSIKLEVSKKYTTLEQVQNTVTGALTDYVTTSDMNSAIQQSADSINLSVSKTYSTKSETTQAKNEAISSASQDATAKANQAKTDAINTSNSATDEKLKKYYTSEQVDAAISLGVGTIDLSVYYTKTETTEVVNTAKSDAISTASTDATTKANNAKNEAINTAANDATTKANAAKDAAINDTTEKLKLYSTTIEMNSAIQLSADGITSTVSKTYATKDSVTGKVDKTSVISSINQTAEEIKISASKISLEGLITANNYFKIKEDGSMEAINGNFSGVVNASSITAPTIEGGSITGSSISTDADVTVGENLYIGEKDEVNQIKYIYFSANSYIRKIVTQSIDYLAVVGGGTAALRNGQGTNVTVFQDKVQMSAQPTIVSDLRKKENISDIYIANLINDVNVVSFNYKNSTTDTVGVIAQDFIGKSYEKYILRQDDDGYYSVDYNVILMALVQKVKELEIKLEEKGK